MAKPSLPLDKRIIVPMSGELIASVDDYKFEHRRASRAAVVRELIALGLDSARRAQSTRRLETALGSFHDKPKDS